MNTTHHYTEEDPILHYYGERRGAGRAERHSSRAARAARPIRPWQAPWHSSPGGASGARGAIRSGSMAHSPLTARARERVRMAAAGRPQSSRHGRCRPRPRRRRVRRRPVWPRQPTPFLRPRTSRTPRTREPWKRILPGRGRPPRSSERMPTDIMNATSRDISVEQAWPTTCSTRAALSAGCRRRRRAAAGHRARRHRAACSRSSTAVEHQRGGARARRRIDAATLLFMVSPLDELRRREGAPAERLRQRQSRIS